MPINKANNNDYTEERRTPEVFTCLKCICSLLLLPTIGGYLQYNVKYILLYQLCIVIHCDELT